MNLFTLTPLEIEALKLSLWVSGWAVVASLPLGILVAWMLARLKFPGKSLMDSLIHLPLRAIACHFAGLLGKSVPRYLGNL